MVRTVIAEDHAHGGGHGAAGERTRKIVTPVGVAAVSHCLARPCGQRAHHSGAGVPEINIRRRPIAGVFVANTIACDHRVDRNSLTGFVKGNFVSAVCYRVVRRWISLIPVVVIAADFETRISDTSESLLGFPQTCRGVFRHGRVQPVVRCTAEVGVSPGLRLYALRADKCNQQTAEYLTGAPKMSRTASSV